MEDQPGLLTEEVEKSVEKTGGRKSRKKEEPVVQLEVADEREAPLVKDLNDPEWAYVLDYEEDGEVYELIFVMKPYLAYDLKLLLADVALSYEPHDQRRIGMSTEGSQVYGSFFDKYFLRVEGLLDPDGSGENASAEDQIAWVNENDSKAAIKRGVVRGGIGNVNTIAGGEIKKGLVIKLGRSGSKIKTWKVLYNAVRKVPDKLFVTHFFDKETDKDRRQYDQATGKSEIIRKKESAFMRSDQNFDSYEQLYDRLAYELEGYLIDGKPCRRDNKDKWIRLVPFWDKYFVVDEHFRAVSSKNA